MTVMLDHGGDPAFESRRAVGEPSMPESELMASGNQWIALASGSIEHVEVMSFPQALGRKHDVSRRKGIHQVVKHHGAPEQDGGPPSGDAADARRCLVAQSLQHAGEGAGFCRRHGVAVHDGQRIAMLRHVEAGNGPPRTTHRVETPVSPGVKPGHIANSLANRCRRMRRVFSPSFLQAQGPDVACRLLPDGAVFDGNEFKAAAAEVRDDAGQSGQCRDDAGCLTVVPPRRRSEPSRHAPSLPRLTGRSRRRWRPALRRPWHRGRDLHRARCRQGGKRAV